MPAAWQLTPVNEIRCKMNLLLIGERVDHKSFTNLAGFQQNNFEGVISYNIRTRNKAHYPLEFPLNSVTTTI